MMEMVHRALPIIKLMAVMYIAATAALWAAVRVLSPVAPEFSIIRGLCSVFLMTIIGNWLQRYLGHSMGNWFMLAKLVVDVLIVKFSFSLSFPRSAIVALVYCTAVGVVFYCYMHFSGHGAVPHLGR